MDAIKNKVCIAAPQLPDSHLEVPIDVSLKSSLIHCCLLMQVKEFKGSDGKTGAAGLAGDVSY